MFVRKLGIEEKYVNNYTFQCYQRLITERVVVRIQNMFFFIIAFKQNWTIFRHKMLYVNAVFKNVSTFIITKQN